MARQTNSTFPCLHRDCTDQRFGYDKDRIRHMETAHFGIYSKCPNPECPGKQETISRGDSVKRHIGTFKECQLVDPNWESKPIKEYKVGTPPWDNGIWPTALRMPEVDDPFLSTFLKCRPEPVQAQPFNSDK